MADKPDLSTYTLDELDTLIAEATQLRDKMASDEIAELEARISKLKSIQAPFQAIGGGGGGSRPKPFANGTGSTGDKRAEVKMQYRGPDGTEYAGRGAIPKWAADMGFTKWADLEEYRIKE